MKNYDGAKGYGFARCDDGSPDVFLHKSVVGDAGLHDLRRGDRIEVETEDTPRELRAVSVRLLP